MGNREVGRSQLLFAAAALLMFVVVQVALAGTSRNEGPRATASGGLQKQIRQLKRRVAALEAKPDQVGQIPTTLPPSGPAGGDLTGSYPAPDIAPNAVGAAEIADFSVGTNEFAFNIPHVRATHSANQPTANGSDTVLSFDSERYDLAALHDNVTSNSRLVASGPLGAYLITASVQFAADPDGVRSVTLRKDGTTAIANDTRSAAISGGVGTTITTVTFLSAGQYVEVVVNQNSGGALDVVKSDQQSPEFAMSYLPSND